MRPIPGFDGYFALVDGTIVGRWGRPIAPYQDKDGYLRVTMALSRGKDAKRVHRGVHQVMCLTYNGEPLDGQEVRHLDGSKRNNRPSNLAWSSHQENMDDQTKHGTVPRGGNHWNAKLTPGQVEDIRVFLAMEIPSRVIAADFSVSRDMINRIGSGKNWR